MLNYTIFVLQNMSKSKETKILLITDLEGNIVLSEGNEKLIGSHQLLCQQNLFVDIFHQ